NYFPLPVMSQVCVSVCVCESKVNAQIKVFAEMGANVTLPCNLMSHDPPTSGHVGVRVKWTKVAEDESLNEDVLLSMGFHKKTYGNFQDRVFLQEGDSEDASLTITSVSLEDTGMYHCEVINGMSDVISTGWSNPTGGPMLAACKLENYDRCDAGWLADGSVRYPISRPRQNCSPTESAVRLVGFPDKTQKSYGVYCYKADQ
uniref:Hyaluronan and proteoglycan link protein 1 n=1 Tax=Cynoglossus semilaevis TaxID=244447 RepID=A0A3P8WJV7_CYNSE